MKAHTGRSRGDLRRRRLLGGERIGNGGGLSRRKGRPGVGDRGVLRRLGASLGFFAIAVNVLIKRAIQAESTKLDCGAVDLIAVTGHANGFKLIKHAPRMVEGSASGRLRCSGGSSNAGGGMLMLRGRERGGCRARSHTARIP